VLHVRPSIREHFLPWLEETYPWLYPLYVQLYGKRSYAPRSYQEAVLRRFASLRRSHGIGAGAGRPRPEAARQLALAV
jgi:hypothetical protein